MLATIEREEKKKSKPLHKGLALHNLGLALFSQGKLREAKECLEKALQEDRRTYGEEKAKGSLAKQALDSLFPKASEKGSQQE